MTRERQTRQTKKVAKNIALVSLMIILFCWCSWYETYYTRDAVVVGVEGEEVIVLDEHGHEWSFIGDEFNVNDNVTLVMNTMHTESNIFDDTIEDVKMR